MSLFDPNLKALSRHNRFFLEDFLRQIPISRAKAAASRQGSQLLVRLPDGSSQTLQHFTGVGPSDPETRFYVVLGFGDGSLVRALLTETAAEHVLIYEPMADLLESLLHLEDFATLFSDARVRLICGVDAGTIQQNLSHFFYEDPFRLTHVFNYSQLTNPGTETLGENRQHYNAFMGALHAEMERKLDRVKPNEEDAFWGVLNLFENYPDYFHLPPLAALRNVCQGKPGVVVASGPSLGRSLKLLKKYRDGVVIFCCDTSLKALQSEGIEPDFVGSIERLGETTIVFSGMTEAPHTPLVAPSLVGAKSLRAYMGPKIALSCARGYDDFIFDDLPQVDVGNAPGVNHLCFVGLRELGCDPILLLGQDLSYDPHTGDSHDSGTDHFVLQTANDMREINGEQTEVFETLGHDGKPRRTTFIWQHFANLYGALIRQHGGDVYNVIPAEMGIPIPMTERLDPEQAFARLVTGRVDRSEILHRLHSYAGDAHHLHETGHKNLKRLRANFDFYSRESLKAMREIAEMWRDHDPRVKNLGYDKLYHGFFDRLEKEIQRIRGHDHGAFNGGFLRLIMGSLLASRIGRAQLRFREEDFLKQTLGLIQNYYSTFNLIHLWASRCLEAMEYHNSHRWKIW